MITEVDERKGLVRKYWEDIRDRVAAVEPEFAKIVDSLNLGKDYPVYLAYYHYGDYISDSQDVFLPAVNGSAYSLKSSSASSEVLKHLGYGIGALPLGMVLEKGLEFFIDIKQQLTAPWMICYPGTLFSIYGALNGCDYYSYVPSNRVLSCTAGARSVCMIANISSEMQHDYLKREYKLRLPAPRSFYEHWGLFKAIANSTVICPDWKVCVLYFSEKWLRSIKQLSSWKKLKLYIHEKAWEKQAYERNFIYYYTISCMIQKKRNLKPNPYVMDTVRHLLAMAAGAVPGYVPTTDENLLPLSLIQNAYVQAFGLKNQVPTVVSPKNFSFISQDELPVYYSLQNPSTVIFSPKSRRTATMLYNLREIEYITSIFVNDLCKKDIVFETVMKNVDFHFFHYEKAEDDVILTSSQIAHGDPRFVFSYPKVDNPIFPQDAKFIRGCIRVSRKN